MSLLRPRSCTGLVKAALIALGTAGLGEFAAGATVEKAVEPGQRYQLLFSFQGKGSCLAYDAGVVTEAYQRLTPLAANQVIVAGSSGGATLAVHFACRGFSPESVEAGVRLSLEADLSPIRQAENVSEKVRKTLAGEPTEVDPQGPLRGYVASALGVEGWRELPDLESVVRRSVYRPRYPLVLVAANREVLDNRVPDNMFRGKNYKQMDTGNYDVSWKAEVFDFYRRQPDRFRTDNPDLKLGSSPRIGKACTYFVDRQMFDLLREIPSHERLGDLRLLETPADLALAIMATCAEPTCFLPVPETDYQKLMVDDRLGAAGNSLRRSYCGGFVMPVVAQDVRRMLPGLRVFDSGGGQWPRMARQVLQAWYLVDAQQLHHLGAWWVDCDAGPTDAQYGRLMSHVLPTSEEFRMGATRTVEALGGTNALPRLTVRPKYCHAARNARLHPASPGLTDAAPGAHTAPSAVRGLQSLTKPIPAKALPVNAKVSSIGAQ